MPRTKQKRTSVKRIKSNLSKNLCFLRLNESLSQEKFVDDLEVFTGIVISRSTYGSYEEGMNEPSIEKLAGISAFYEISLHDLCFKDLQKEAELARKANKSTMKELIIDASLEVEFNQTDENKSLRDLILDEFTLLKKQENGFKDKKWKDFHIGAYHISEFTPAGMPTDRMLFMFYNEVISWNKKHLEMEIMNLDAQLEHMQRQI